MTRRTAVAAAVPDEHDPRPLLVSVLEDVIAGIEAEIHHAEDNGHVITDGDGIDVLNGERAPGVRISHLRVVLDRVPR